MRPCSRGAGQISSGTPLCRINAAFHLTTERRIYAAAKNAVMRPLLIVPTSTLDGSLGNPHDELGANSLFDKYYSQASKFFLHQCFAAG